MTDSQLASFCNPISNLDKPDKFQMGADFLCLSIVGGGSEGEWEGCTLKILITFQTSAGVCENKRPCEKERRFIDSHRNNSGNETG